MAGPVGHRHSLSTPPPVYFRSSPPISQSRATPKRFSMGIPQKPVTASQPQAPLIQNSSVRIDAKTPYESPQVEIFDYDIPPVPVSAFSNLSVGEGEQEDFRPDVPSHKERSYGHTPASSGSWSVVDTDKEKLGQQSGSSFDRESHNSSRGSLDSMPSDNYEPLHYHHQPWRSSNTSKPAETPISNTHLSVRPPLPRPNSVYSSTSDLGPRNFSPQTSPYLHARSSSRNSTASPDTRPLSFVDLLNSSYPQPGPVPVQLGNSHLRSAVGNNASLLSHKQTFDMYLANVKKTDDPAVLYEFAVFMVNAMLEMPDAEQDGKNTAGKNEITRAGLLKEARSILQRLADRSYPFAQYYLGDGYASGLFSKGKEDYDRAFPLFVAASKHGHVEACYRAALCYEFGWGNRVDAARAVQFYRQAASKNHPGAMMRMAKACLAGDMGLGKRYREGLKWMKRAAESSDAQYNSAPYELGLLHETGYGDDVFPDPAYAAQLFTKSADLGHVEACYRLGDAYEHGKLNCPRDPALSIHFYTGAAQRGHPLAMMALCAWYLLGAEPVLEKDESEAYEWAKRAAETELSKAEYAVGYFTEMGIGCRRDPLEANVWYVKAAEQGDARAKHRIAAIQAAADGADPTLAAAGAINAEKDKKKGGKKRFSIF